MDPGLVGGLEVDESPVPGGREGPARGVRPPRNRALGRLVAIKVLLPGRADDETARKRFEREAKASASLSHPNVVDVYRFGRLGDGTPYLVMRFVKGRTMEERMRVAGRIDVDTVRTVLREVASGLASAHAQGMVHQDVRPGNILRDEERGEALGPYGSRNGKQLVAAHLTGEPRDLRALRADVDPGLADLLRRCLAREPRHRPSARDVVRVLEGPGDGRPGTGTASSLLLGPAGIGRTTTSVSRIQWSRSVPATYAPSRISLT